MFISYPTFVAKKVSSTELQQKTKKVIDQVRFGKEPVVIYHYNEPVAVLGQYVADYSHKENNPVKVDKQEKRKLPSLDELRRYMVKTDKPTDYAAYFRKMRDEE